MIAFLFHELAINDFEDLVTKECVQWLHHGMQVKALWNWIQSVLALWRAIVIVRTFEDETQTFRYKTDLTSFTPAHEVQGQLANAIVVTHAVHGITPTGTRVLKRLGS